MKVLLLIALAIALAGCNTVVPTNNFNSTVDCNWNGTMPGGVVGGCQFSGHLHHSVGSPL